MRCLNHDAQLHPFARCQAILAELGALHGVFDVPHRDAFADALFLVEAKANALWRTTFASLVVDRRALRLQIFDVERIFLEQDAVRFPGVDILLVDQALLALLLAPDIDQGFEPRDALRDRRIVGACQVERVQGQLHDHLTYFFCSFETGSVAGHDRARQGVLVNLENKHAAVAAQRHVVLYNAIFHRLPEPPAGVSAGRRLEGRVEQGEPRADSVQKKFLRVQAFQKCRLDVAVRGHDFFAKGIARQDAVATLRRPIGPDQATLEKLLPERRQHLDDVEQAAFRAAALAGQGQEAVVLAQDRLGRVRVFLLVLHAAPNDFPIVALDLHVVRVLLDLVQFVWFQAGEPDAEATPCKVLSGDPLQRVDKVDSVALRLLVDKS